MPDKTLSLHAHSTYSARDSIIQLPRFAAKVAAAGCTHLAISDHGTIQGWLALRDACKANKLTPVYGCELYVNDLIPGHMQVIKAREAAPGKTKAQAVIRAMIDHVFPLCTKVQSEYLMANLEDAADEAKTARQLTFRTGHGYQHLVATAITKQGRDNLIKLVNRGYQDGYYIKPQVTTAQCKEFAEGIVWTTACMGGPISRRLGWDETGAEAERYLKLWEFTKENFFLEVQPLDLLHQRRYNQKLIDLAKKTGFPLIISQDCHHLNEDEWFAHRVLMLSQNDKSIESIEEFYDVAGQEVSFSDLKKRFGTKTSWQAQEIIERDKIPMIRKAGHHYSDLSLAWRTNDKVREQCDTTNPELIPVLDACFESCERIRQQSKPIEWPTAYRFQRTEGSAEKLLAVCHERLKNLGITGSSQEQKYLDWLEKERKVITACDFWDYIFTLYRWTKKVQEEGIPLGYARGSGGACLILYLTGITRIDPVRYDLFFERFLNPARLGLDPKTLEKVKEASSCPDVDLDFSSIHRERVIQIAVELFGRDRVVPVGTIGEARIKTCLADICRVMGIKQSEFMPASKDIPDDPGNVMTFEKAMEVPSFARFLETRAVLLKTLPSLIGVIRSTGTHAGGICISDVPVADIIPVVRSGAKEGAGLVTGFGESGAERALESTGNIKFDALSIDTVDHVSLCAKALYKEHLAKGGEPWVKPGELLLYPEQIPFFNGDDPAVMKAVFHTGNTDGIFQFEEALGKDMVRLIKPEDSRELANCSTLLRPGCLQAPCTVDGESGVGIHFEYAGRKFRPQKNPPPVGLPEEILSIVRPTHYVVAYQEQMMALLSAITNGKMSLGEGDLYRRAIEQAGKGKEEFKKKVQEIEDEAKKVSSYPKEIVDRVCEMIKGGASYSFNRSHSQAYAMLGTAQAWFKHYYPHIFFASHITILAAKNKLSKAHKIINDARSYGITIRSPHVHHSTDETTWSADGKTIYLPLTIIKGLKDETAAAICDIGKTKPDLAQFIIAAVANPHIKKNHVISLAEIGALDNLTINGVTLSRLSIVATCNYVIGMSTTKTSPEKIQALIDEASKFIVVGDNVLDRTKAALAEIEHFGSFIQECPLDKHVESLVSRNVIPLSQIEPEEDQEFMVYFMITAITKKAHKSGKNIGKEWYKLSCWDGHATCELSVWATDLDGKSGCMGYRKILMPNQVYVALVQSDGERPTTLAFRSERWDNETRSCPTVRETLWLQSAK